MTISQQITALENVLKDGGITVRQVGPSKGKTNLKDNFSYVLWSGFIEENVELSVYVIRPLRREMGDSFTAVWDLLVASDDFSPQIEGTELNYNEVPPGSDTPSNFCVIPVRTRLVFNVRGGN